MAQVSLQANLNSHSHPHLLFFLRFCMVCRWWVRICSK